jgi:hypothetical protein
MLLTFPMASDPFATMQKKGFSMSYPVVTNAKIEFVYMF